MNLHSRNTILGVIILCILSIPLIAMQFSTEVDWSLNDFAFAALLLFGTGLLTIMLYSKIKTSKYYLVLLIIVVLAFILLWAELAVGIFNSPISGS